MGIGSTGRILASVLSPSGRRARLAVFCYHQVLERPDPLREGEPTEDDFKRDVDLIRDSFNVLTFGQAVAQLASGNLPERAACITFDDGYANNHALAAPILENAGVPATFFVAGSAIDDGVMWNDLVIDAIAGSGGDRSAVMSAIAALKYRPPDERWASATALYRDRISDTLPRLMMTREMLRDLSARGFEIGGHTISHPILKTLPDDDARKEIEECSHWVREVTGTKPVSFAFPNGKPGIDFEDRHLPMVAAAGFSAAASTVWGLADATSNLLSVPRLGPWWRQGRGFSAGLLRAYVRSYLP